MPLSRGCVIEFDLRPSRSTAQETIGQKPPDKKVHGRKLMAKKKTTVKIPGTRAGTNKAGTNKAGSEKVGIEKKGSKAPVKKRPRGDGGPIIIDPIGVPIEPTDFTIRATKPTRIVETSSTPTIAFGNVAVSPTESSIPVSVRSTTGGITYNVTDFGYSIDFDLVVDPRDPSKGTLKIPRLPLKAKDTLRKRKDVCEMTASLNITIFVRKRPPTR